jgi:hypothetical protein
MDNHIESYMDNSLDNTLGFILWRCQPPWDICTTSRPTIRLVEFVDQGCSRGDLQSRDHVIRDAFNPRGSIRIALGKVIDTNGKMGL